MSLVLHIVVLLAVAEGLRTRGRAAVSSSVGSHTNEDYNFDQFVREYSRTYETGSEEYNHRANVFRESMFNINVQNSRKITSWKAGLHPFMDWTGAERAERLHGYDPSVSSRVAKPTSAVELLTSAQANLRVRVYGGEGDSYEAKGPAVRDQGSLCGSCWAFAAVGVVEAQLMKDDSPWPRRQMGEPRLSVQALLDCVANPKHCGGRGGCDGATPELAFDFMRDSGIPLEVDLNYAPNHMGKCPIEPYPSDWLRVTLAGWRALPRNRAQPLMHALVKHGPVVVAADAHAWYPYKSGIFDGCSKDAIPNHSVMATGYGAAGGKKYWLLQNSWSTRWGEHGFIRILRRDDEDRWCGVDSRPQEGFACEGEANRNVTVCGTCGLLLDPIVPVLGHLLVGQGLTSDDSEADTLPRAAMDEGDEEDTEDSQNPGHENGGVVVDASEAELPPSGTQAATTDAPSFSKIPHWNAASATAAMVHQAMLHDELFAQRSTITHAADTPASSASAIPLDDRKQQDEGVPISAISATSMPTDVDISKSRWHDFFSDSGHARLSSLSNQAEVVDPFEASKASWSGAGPETDRFALASRPTDAMDIYERDADSHDNVKVVMNNAAVGLVVEDIDKPGSLHSESPQPVVTKETDEHVWHRLQDGQQFPDPTW